MNTPYLIQRLKKPGNQSPFAFGGGYKNGGLSEDAADSLNYIWSYDYMGAAEFEFGAIPESLDYICLAKANYVINSIEIDGMVKHYPTEALLKNTMPVYYICQKIDEKEVISWLKKFADDITHNYRTKEHVGLAQRIAIPGWNENLVGWHDIKNHFLFFIDKEMCDKFCKLIELTS